MKIRRNISAFLPISYLGLLMGSFSLMGFPWVLFKRYDTRRNRRTVYLWGAYQNSCKNLQCIYASHNIIIYFTHNVQAVLSYS